MTTTAFRPFLGSAESVGPSPSSIVITAPSTMTLFVANARENFATAIPFGTKYFFGGLTGVVILAPFRFPVCEQGRKGGERIIFM